MKKQELLDYIQDRLSGLGQCDWYTSECFVREMQMLIYQERNEEAH